MKPALLKPKAVANRLGIGMSATYELLSSGKIPSVRIGTGRLLRYRVDADVLERWIAAHTESKRTRSNRRPLTREEECQALGIEAEHEFVN